MLSYEVLLKVGVPLMGGRACGCTTRVHFARAGAWASPAGVAASTVHERAVEHAAGDLRVAERGSGDLRPVAGTVVRDSNALRACRRTMGMPSYTGVLKNHGRAVVHDAGDLRVAALSTAFV